MKRKRYRTGLISAGDFYEPLPPYDGCGWRATWESQRRKHPPTSGKQVVIYTKDWPMAQKALDLISGALELVSGGMPLRPERLVARTRTEPRLAPGARQLVEQELSTPDISLACAVAAKASRRTRFVYAIAKYSFSLTQQFTHVVDLEPFRSRHLPVSRFPSDHVRFAQAVVAAYSAIEEVGLEIRASSKNPSKINGKWNPTVCAELESRLRDAGVDPSETLLWTRRGPPKRTELQGPHAATLPARWAGGLVRDVEMPLIDAIAQASWLRSKAAAHKANRISASLSPYDVANVQHLARLLLLRSVGF